MVLHLVPYASIFFHTKIKNPSLIRGIGMIYIYIYIYIYIRIYIPLPYIKKIINVLFYCCVYFHCYHAFHSFVECVVLFSLLLLLIFTLSHHLFFV